VDRERVARNLVKLAKELVAAKFEFKRLKGNPNSWYNNPQMRGHTSAKKTVDELERIVVKYSKTPEQRFIIGRVIDFVQDDWDYFHKITKKYMANLLFTLKNLDKLGPLGMLIKYQSRSGIWREDVERILNVMAYDDDPASYVDEYISQYIYLGMEPEEAKERIEKLVKVWRSDMSM